MPKIIIPIRGMHCKSCEILVEQNISKIAGVKTVNVNHQSGQANIFFDGPEPAKVELQKAVEEAGYKIGNKEKIAWFSKNSVDYKNLFFAGVILLVLYALAKWFGLFSLDIKIENSGVLVALLVGLLAGVSTCMALVGGLVLGLSARHAELHPEATAKQKFIPHIFFNFGRILGFAFLGGTIGLVGSSFKMSTNLLGLLTIVVGIVMLFLGIKLVEIFPILSNKTIALPKLISKIFGLNRNVKEYSHKNSFIVGALTFFLPCGFTQAMQLFAVSTGSFISGALIMGLFALGTAPGLLGIGGLSAIFSARGGSALGGRGRKAKIFFATAGVAVIIFGWFNVVNGSRLISFKSSVSTEEVSQTSVIQEVRMIQDSYGYKPSEFIVKKGVKVKWIITSVNPYTCAASIVMPQYGITKYLEKGENVIEFTPTETGTVSFSCGMGMYRGKFIVE